MKKNRRKRSKNKSTWFFRVIAIISIIIFIVFGIMLYVLDMIPFKFLIIFYIVFGLLYLYLFITSFPKKIKNKFRISSCVFLILFGTIFGVGIKYLNDTMDFVGIISKDLLQKEVYYVMTLDSSTIKNVKDLDNKTIGIYSSKNSEEAIKLLDKKIDSTNKEYKNIVELFEDLQDKKIDAVLINDSTKNLLSSDLSDMKLKLKDPWSAITHGIALLLAAAGAAPLLLKAAHGEHAPLHITALAIFILTMILLYTASTVYHSVDSTEKVNRRLRKMDHMMIFVMIAGSYTPVCLIVLHNRIGYILCALVWSIAVLGIILKGCWITCPKWLSSVLYIAMGWLCVLAFVPIFHALPRAGFDWLLAGGIIYTIGGVIYALKGPLFNSRHKNFGSHEIFHIFVMLGSACHFIVMYFFVAPLPV